MRRLICVIWIITLSCYSLLAFSAEDPVAWSLNPPTGFPVTTLGSQSQVTYTLTSNLPASAVIYTSFNIQGTGFAFADHCHNVTLSPQHSCTITITFTPTTAGNNSVQLIYGYHNNRIPLPTLSAVGSGGDVSSYSLTGAFPNFPTTIFPTGTYQFTAVFTNTGQSELTNCFAGNVDGTGQFVLTPSNAANITVTDNGCGTVGSTINLTTTGQTRFCTITATMSGPYHPGAITLSSTMRCAQASATPTVHATITTPSPALTGQFTTPNPFPSTFFDNQSPTFTAMFQNTGNVNLTNCYAKDGVDSYVGGFQLSPGSAGTVSTTSQQSTCGTPGSKIPLNIGDICYLYGQMSSLSVTTGATLTGSVICEQASASPSETFNIVHNSGSCTTVTVAPLYPLPTNSYVYANNLVTFQVTNTCPNQVGLGTFGVTATTGTATITTPNGIDGYDHCSGETLNSAGQAGDSCLVTSSIIPTTTGNLVIQGAVTPNSPSVGSQAVATTSTTAANNQTATHHLYFVNQCDFDVWYGIGNAAGVSGNASPDPNLVQYPTGAPSSAYYLPAQVPYQAPSTIDLPVSAYINGAMWPRTGCQMINGQFVCATGYCTTIPSTATCVSGDTTGNMPIPPFTKIEQTIESTAGTDGVYDVSVINGMNVPVEMKAFGPLGANAVNPINGPDAGLAPGDPGDVYTCSSAGTIIQPTQSTLLLPCTWSYNPASSLSGIANVNSDFYWVTPGANTDCNNSGVSPLCGMGANVAPPANIGSINRLVGDFLGFSTLTNYAGYPLSSQWGSTVYNLYNNYGMGTPITGDYPPPNNYTVLISCNYQAKFSTGANSCNLNSLTAAEYNTCCGCTNWVGTATVNTPCGDYSNLWPGGTTNSLWTTNTPSQSIYTYNLLDGVTWIKSACPTAYAYQFDDTASSFQCNKDGAVNLYTSYQITFCPGGVSGLPSGATDGRSTVP